MINIYNTGCVMSVHYSHVTFPLLDSKAKFLRLYIFICASILHSLVISVVAHFILFCHDDVTSVQMLSNLSDITQNISTV
jgi:hypothetical protein